MSVQMPTKFLTRRLLLRKPEPADAEHIFSAYAQDPQVTHFLTWPPHDSLVTTRAFIAWGLEAWESGRRFPYAICLRWNGDLIGMIDARFDNGKVEFGYVLAQRYWHQGYMPETLSALIDFALSQPGVYRAWAVCDVDNYGSKRVLEKAGLQYECVLRSWSLHPNISNEPRDCHLFAKIKNNISSA